MGAFTIAGPIKYEPATPSWLKEAEIPGAIIAWGTEMSNRNLYHFLLHCYTYIVPVAVVLSPRENHVADTSVAAGPIITPASPFRIAATWADLKFMII